MTKVVVLMLTYNNPDEAKKSVNQVAKFLIGHTFLVMDNGSTKDMPDYQLPNILYSGYSQNRGVAGGRNGLIDWALARSDHDVFVFLDSDIEVIDPSWIARLIKPLEQENIGVCGVSGSYIDWSQKHPFVPAPVGECDVVSGWCLAVKREVIDLAGVRMDESYGLFYEEDSDFCMQVRAAGWDVWCTGDVGLKHTPSNSGANLADRAATLSRFRDKWHGKALTRGEGAYA